MASLGWLLFLASCVLSAQGFSPSSATSPRGSLNTYNTRENRHFSRIDVCEDAICDQILRQAQGLSRVKLIRRYVRDTVATLDKLVTALDKELIDVGKGLEKSLGKSCRAALAVLGDVTKDSLEFAGSRWRP